MAINAIQPTTNKPHTGKKIAGAALTAAAAAGTVLYLAKTGKLNAVENGNPALEKVKAVLKKPADFVNGKIAQGIEVLKNNEKIGRKMAKIQTFAKDTAHKFEANPTVGAAKNLAKTEGAKAKAFIKDIPARVAKAVDTAKDFVESKINLEKFAK